MAGHSVTVGDTISVSSAQINGATAFEVSGNASPSTYISGTYIYIYIYVLGLNDE